MTIRKIILMSALLIGGYAASAQQAGDVPGTASSMTMGNTINLYCTKSPAVCCNVSVKVDNNGRIHIMIANHDGIDYDVVLTAPSPAAAKAQAIADLQGPGLEIPN